MNTRIYLNKKQVDYILINFNCNLVFEQIADNEFVTEISETELNSLIDYIDEETYLMEESLQEDGHDFENDPYMIFLKGFFSNLIEARNPDNN